VLKMSRFLKEANKGKTKFNWTQFHRDLDYVVSRMIMELDKIPSRTKVMDLISYSYEKTKTQFPSGMVRGTAKMSPKKHSLGSFQGLAAGAEQMTDGFINLFVGLFKVFAFLFISVFEGFQEFWNMGKQKKKDGKKKAK